MGKIGGTPARDTLGDIAILKNKLGLLYAKPVLGQLAKLSLYPIIILLSKVREHATLEQTLRQAMNSEDDCDAVIVI